MCTRYYIQYIIYDYYSVYNIIIITYYYCMVFLFTCCRYVIIIINDILLRYKHLSRLNQFFFYLYYILYNTIHLYYIGYEYFQMKC